MKRILTIFAVLAFASCEKQTAEVRITKEILRSECPGCKLTHIAQREATAAVAAQTYRLAGQTPPREVSDVFLANHDAIIGEIVLANATRRGGDYTLIAIYSNGKKKFHYLFAVTN